jgi:hypothetical protein
MAEGQYRIVKAQLPLIGGLAGHNFLALIDPDGNVIGELHGLATGADGRPKPIGHLPSDELRGYDDQHFYKPGFAQAELASGDQADIMNRWHAGRAVLDKINAHNIHYPRMGLGQNSNSFANTLISGMGLTERPMRGGAPVMPGARSMLLDDKDIQDIRRQFNIGTARPGDTPVTGSRSDDIGEPNSLDEARWPYGPVGAPRGRATVAPSLAKAVPGAEGTTSLGGPNGPAPLVPDMRSRSPAVSAPVADPVLPPLHFAPDERSNAGSSGVPWPFRSNASTSSNVSTAPFPLEVLLAPDRDGALDRWASSVRKRDASPSTQVASLGLASATDRTAASDPSNAGRSSARGLLGLIQDYMRSNAY